MAKNKITDYSTTAASNTDVGGVDIQGTAPASNMDDSVRELQSHLAETNAGSAPWADTMTLGDAADLTKEVRFELSGITAGQTRVLTVPDSDGTLMTSAANPTLATIEALTLGAGDMLYATAADTLADLAIGTAGQFLVTNAGATAPEWASRPTLVSLEGLSLAAGDVLYATAADTLERLAKGTYGQVLRINSGATAPEWGAVPLLHLQDQKAAGTDGGTFTSGAWQTRTLNTEVTDEIGSTLSSNQFTLPAGTYEIRASAPAVDTAAHVAKLVNITDTADTLIGTADSSPAFGSPRSFINGRFTIAAQKTFEIQHRCTNTKNTTGFGDAVNVGVTEIYTDVMIWRVA